MKRFISTSMHRKLVEAFFGRILNAKGKERSVMPVALSEEGKLLLDDLLASVLQRFNCAGLLDIRRVTL